MIRKKIEDTVNDDILLASNNDGSSKKGNTVRTKEIINGEGLGTKRNGKKKGKKRNVFFFGLIYGA